MSFGYPSEVEMHEQGATSGLLLEVEELETAVDRGADGAVADNDGSD